jgi:hypothetical protein
LAWFRLVPTGFSPKKSGERDRSMSSENRSITPNTFERDVPPLNTKAFANRDENRTASIQLTQKSFSMMTGTTFFRTATCSM